MLRIITLFVLFISIGLGAFSQQKPVEKAVIKTPTIQCDKCKERIENFLGREDGMISVKVDLKKKTVAVSWYTDRTNIENIKTDIANLGYDADEITANEDSYKRLPKCCKKPAAAALATPIKN